MLSVVYRYEAVTLSCIPKKSSQVGVSRSTRRNLPQSVGLSVCLLMYHELVSLTCYLLSLPLEVRSARYAGQGFRGGGLTGFFRGREMPPDPLRMMSGVSKQKPPPHPSAPQLSTSLVPRLSGPWV